MMNGKRIDEAKDKVFATFGEAFKVAEALQAGELDGWSYVVTGLDSFKVRIHDAEGVFVAYWKEC